MEDATAQAAQEILERSRIPNAVQARVEEDNLTKKEQWRRIIEIYQSFRSWI